MKEYNADLYRQLQYQLVSDTNWPTAYNQVSNRLGHMHSMYVEDQPTAIRSYSEPI